MATSYRSSFKIITADYLFSTNSNFRVNFENSELVGIANNLTALLNLLKASLEGTLGGTFSWTTTSDATYTYYAITYDGLTTDPSADLNNELISFTILDTNDLTTSGKFISSENCTGEGLCPDCPDCPPSVNPEDCLSCYEQQVDNCADEIVIYGLEDTTTYVVNISDPQSGKTYTSTKISDVNGEITLDTGDYPAGLFSPYNSPLTLTILQNGSPVTLTYGYVNYSCIDIVVQNQTEI